MATDDVFFNGWPVNVFASSPGGDSMVKGDIFGNKTFLTTVHVFVIIAGNSPHQVGHPIVKLIVFVNPFGILHSAFLPSLDCGVLVGKDIRCFPTLPDPGFDDIQDNFLFKLVKGFADNTHIHGQHWFEPPTDGF
ncbi:hypothetical protein DSECCO2_595280 [anaerobic digester metagenome]